MDIRLRIKEFLQQYQTTGWLLALMIGGLLLQGVLYLILSIFGQTELYTVIIDGLVIPPTFKEFIWHPWSLVTYPFFSVRFDLFQLLFNGLIIWTFGRVHQQLLGEQRTRRLVILGIPLIGLLTLIITSIAGFYYSPATGSGDFRTQPQTTQVAPEGGTLEDSTTDTVTLTEDSEEEVRGFPMRNKSLAYLSGLGAIIFILVISCITLVPDYPVQLFLFGQVKIVWVGVVLFLLAWGLWASFFTPMGIAILLGGMLGFAHVYLLRNGTDITETVWGFYSDGSNKPRMKVKYGSKTPGSKPQPSSRKKNDGSDISQDVIDDILDKISDKGYDSLSREEKELLFKASTQKGDGQD